MTTSTNGWEIPPLCKVNGCELPSQTYSKISMNSKGSKKYLKTCRHHTYEHIKEFEKITAK
jgi:hypothetical protein